MKRRVFALSLALAFHASAQISPDWRLIGGSVDSYTFYDASGARKLPNGHFEVWLKGLPAKPTENAASAMEKDKENIERIAKKLVNGYKPPVARRHKLTHVEIVNAIAYEAVANDADVEPIMRMLLQIDCSSRLFRHMSIYIKHGAKSLSSESASEWQHVAPETNVAVLLMELCPAN